MPDKQGPDPIRRSAQDLAGASDPGMSHEEFRAIRDLIRDRSGLAFPDDSRYAFDRRLRERIGELGLSGFPEYYRVLRQDVAGDGEMQEVYDLLITRETYFFREEYQLRGFRDEVLPVLAAPENRHKQITIWSAGCSTGEEAYSIAMVLLEAGTQGHKARVHGTDLSRRNVAIARKGLYSDSAFRSTSDERKRRFFVERDDGLQVCEPLRSMCQFGTLNLLEMDRAPRFMQLDVIFCKNVLIYFDSVARRRVISGFHDRLRPGGYLFLGHSESLLNEPGPFEHVHLASDVVYRKPAHPTVPPASRRRAR